MKINVVKDSAKIEIFGHVVDREGHPLNTRDHPVAMPRKPIRRDRPRARMILNVGTAISSGKTTSSIACCRVLSSMGFAARASRETGSAILKYILHMRDAGVEAVSDFAGTAFPSTYLLEERELVRLFENLDAKSADNPARFWALRLSEGILQLGTAILLQNPGVRSRIHRSVFCAVAVFGELAAYGSCVIGSAWRPMPFWNAAPPHRR